MTIKAPATDNVKWVAHRGYAEAYPENTLIGLEAALDEGADAVEFDILLTKDLVPVLLHDTSLLRTAAMDVQVSALTWAELTKISVHEPERFGDRYAPCLVSDLATVVSALAPRLQNLFFVEVKKECFEQVSREALWETMAAILAPIKERAVMISYDLRWLQLAKTRGWRNGWVLTKFDEDSHAVQQENAFDFCICNIEKIMKAGRSPWQGDWAWFVYDVLDRETLDRCLALGINWIETWDIKRMKAICHD